MERVIPAVVLCAIAFLTACAQHGYAAVSAAGDLKNDFSDVRPVTPATDHREYRYFELDNGLKVLAISDPDTITAAASLNVNIGSFQDPKNREGLAHFLEHMLFMGTAKYPEPGEYEAYLDANGGDNNAYTSYHFTNYHFSVNANAFAGAVDRFAQFFIAPLFTPEFVDREKKAIHSEYFTRIGKDNIRRYEVTESEMNPDHPVWKFNVGTRDTLADNKYGKVRDDLLRFYHTWYSADKMALVLLGNQSLDQLAELARQKFSTVPRLDQVPETRFGPIFAAGELPRVIEIEPVKETRSLNLMFPLPPMQQFYREKPLTFVARLIGYEGPGSLYSALKTRGWIESLTAGGGDHYGDNDTFKVTAWLTPDGVDHQDDIIAALFDVVKLARDQGVEKWRFDEIRHLSESAFRFREQGSAKDYVIDLANNLQRYPAREVVSAPSTMSHFDADLIAGVFSRLRPDNMLVTLTAPGVTTDADVPVSTVKTTRFYDTQYRSYRPTAQRVAHWQQPFDDNFRLAARNPFVPESLDLVAAERPAQPLHLDNTGSVDLWHYPDTSFGVPKVSVGIAIDRPGMPTAHQTAVETLYFVLLSEQLNDLREYASDAGVGFRVDSGGISFSGFSDKLMVLADAVLSELTELKFSQQQFDLIKAAFMRSIRNANLAAPYQRLGRDVSKLLNAESITSEQFGDALAEVTSEDLRNAPQQLYRGVRVQILAAGNITEQQARELSKKVYDVLELTDTDQPIELGSRIIKLEPTEQRDIYLKALGHKDAGVVRYYQGRDNSSAERARLTLIGQMIAQSYFQQLRTRQQLGYVVRAGSFRLDRVPGLSFMVQSPSVDVNAIEAATDKFLPTFKSALDEMTEEEFAGYRDALVIQLQQQPKNLSERVGQLWNDLRNGYLNFDSREQFTAAVNHVTLGDLRVAYQEIVLASAPRAISVVSPGEKGGITGTINGFNEFRRGKDIYTRN